MSTNIDVARTVATALLVATVAAGCASPTAPAVDDPVAAPSTRASTAPDHPPSPTPDTDRRPAREPGPTEETAGDTDQGTVEPSPQPAREPTSTAADPPPDERDDGLTELPTFKSDGSAPAFAVPLTLHADAATGCMWIEIEQGGGRDGEVYATRFEPRYRGRFTTDPPELVRIDRDTGEPVVVATAGETWEGTARVVEGQLDECHVGPENTIALLY